MANLTSANSSFNLTADGYYAGVKIEGYATDDAFAFGAIESGVATMGIDGKMSKAWVPQIKTQTISLQADSESVKIFKAIYEFQEINREVIDLSATITVPSIGMAYTLSNGVMTSYTPVSAHGRTLGAMAYTISWGSVRSAKL